MRLHAPSTGFFALLTPALLLLGSAWLATPSFAAPAPKVDVCHVPPGNPANAHVINVSQNALPAHLQHGDFVGVGAACSVGVGECSAEGTTQCDAAGSCSAVPGLPSPELCDGLDNDCDGVVDNDTGDGTVCACPCAATWENGESFGAPDIRTQTGACEYPRANDDVIAVFYSPGDAYVLVREEGDDYCADAAIGNEDDYNFGLSLTDEDVSDCKQYLENLGCDFGG